MGIHFWHPEFLSKDADYAAGWLPAKISEKEW